jgi:hypothetical protein
MLLMIKLIRFHIFALSFFMIWAAQSYFGIVNNVFLMLSAFAAWTLYFLDGFLGSPEDVFNKKTDLVLWKRYKNAFWILSLILLLVTGFLLMLLLQNSNLSADFYAALLFCFAGALLYLFPKTQQCLKRKIALKVTVISLMWTIGSFILPLLVLHKSILAVDIAYLFVLRFLVFIPNLLWELHLDHFGDAKIYASTPIFDLHKMLLWVNGCIIAFIGFGLLFFPMHKIWFLAELLTVLAIWGYSLCTKTPQMLILDLLLATGSVFVLYLIAVFPDFFKH